MDLRELLVSLFCLCGLFLIPAGMCFMIVRMVLLFAVGWQIVLVVPAFFGGCFYVLLLCYYLYDEVFCRG